MHQVKVGVTGTRASCNRRESSMWRLKAALDRHLQWCHCGGTKIDQRRTQGSDPKEPMEHRNTSETQTFPPWSECTRIARSFKLACWVGLQELCRKGADLGRFTRSKLPKLSTEEADACTHGLERCVFFLLNDSLAQNNHVLMEHAALAGAVNDNTSRTISNFG